MSIISEEQVQGLKREGPRTGWRDDKCGERGQRAQRAMSRNHQEETGCNCQEASE